MSGLSGGTRDSMSGALEASGAGGLRAELLAGIQRHRAAFAAAGDEAAGRYRLESAKSGRS
jgi:hypothetical protein